jgi:hypothetical protein
LTNSRYAAAGVDIDAKAVALARAKEVIRSTFTPGVLGDVGSRRRGRRSVERLSRIAPRAESDLADRAGAPRNMENPLSVRRGSLEPRLVPHRSRLALAAGLVRRPPCALRSRAVSRAEDLGLVTDGSPVRSRSGLADHRRVFGRRSIPRGLSLHARRPRRRGVRSGDTGS